MSKWYNVNMNTSKNQSKFGKERDKDLKEMFKHYKELEEPEPEPEEEEEEVIVTPCTGTFCDDFETDWSISNTYISAINENFEQQWFINNNFINDFEDVFDTDWFINNNYIIQDSEDFEDVDWDE